MPPRKRITASRATPIELVIGYQPYYTESWSGVIMRDKKFYEKYLPKGSTVSFQIGLQGAIIVNGMLAGKVDIGYVGDMPAIVSTSHADVRDIRIVSVLGLGYDQCNVFLARPDAPQFKSPEEAHQVARRQDGRGAEGKLHRPLRASRVQAPQHQAVRISRTRASR